MHSKNLLNIGGPDPLDSIQRRTHSAEPKTKATPYHTPARRSDVVTRKEKEEVKKDEKITWDSSEGEDDEKAAPVLRTPRARSMSPDTMDRTPTRPKKKSRKTRDRKRWTQEEVDRLYAGVVKFGHGHWKDMCDYYDFSERTPHDLKDKWRNEEKREEECVAKLEETKQLIENRKRAKEQNSNKSQKRQKQSSD
eukprot:TRINITY_DN3713_c0_g1_i2.p1 TRINITY_DN3713_c0_g1~~TRINITY_DN3713_c0_g1_i2.p1  ORF type:complete len:222 (+),score=79.02 TRINITY_DN3713_c0_g1_i2:86-667(+)